MVQEKEWARWTQGREDQDKAERGHKQGRRKVKCAGKEVRGGPRRVKKGEAEKPRGWEIPKQVDGGAS